MINLSTVLSNENSKNILIVYGSFSGSTKEIADSMKTYLLNNSIVVDVLEANKKNIDLSKYDLVIIGSAIHGNAPHPNVVDFVDVNRDDLRIKKIAVFVVCGTITSSKKSKRDTALTYPDKLANGLKIVDKTVFAGNMISNGKKFDDFMGKLFLGIVPGDYRNWDKIKTWANDLSKK